MAAEIERKFLLDEPPGWLQDFPSTRISQGYLAIGEEAEVRLRSTEERRLLAVKRGHGEMREEVEVDLGTGQFDSLWPLTEGGRLRKTRYLVPIADGLDAEVDVFEGGLEGLVTAEVEFDDEARSRAFEPPAWLGVEITGDGRYANQTLAVDGLRDA
jgi:adenylate cyclase